MPARCATRHIHASGFRLSPREAGGLATFTTTGAHQNADGAGDAVLVIACSNVACDHRRAMQRANATSACAWRWAPQEEHCCGSFWWRAEFWCIGLDGRWVRADERTAEWLSLNEPGAGLEALFLQARFSDAALVFALAPNAHATNAPVRVRCARRATLIRRTRRQHVLRFNFAVLHVIDVPGAVADPAEL